MLIAAVLLIATTIRLSAFSRRRELGIMRLVGASNRFIQTPFILEGVFAALIGSVLAGGAIVAIVQFFVQGYLANGRWAPRHDHDPRRAPGCRDRRADPHRGRRGARRGIRRRRDQAVPQGVSHT